VFNLRRSSTTQCPSAYRPNAWTSAPLPSGSRWRYWGSRSPTDGKFGVRVERHCVLFLDQRCLSHASLELGFRNSLKTRGFLVIHELWLGWIEERRTAGIAVTVFQNPIIAGIADCIGACRSPLPKVEIFSRRFELVQVSGRLDFVPCAVVVTRRPGNQQIFSDVADPPAFRAPVWMRVDCLSGHIARHRTRMLL